MSGAMSLQDDIVRYLNRDNEKGDVINPSDVDMAPADSSTTMEWAGATIPIGQKKYCKGWVIYHPGNFFVINGRMWNVLEGHQQDFSKFCDALFKKPLSNSRQEVEQYYCYKPEPTDLISGQYIAVFHDDDNEWHRGLLLQCPSKKSNIYKVMMVDYGDHYNYTLDRIRLIPKVALKFPAQAIKCALYFDAPGESLHAQHKQFEWTNEEACLFADIMTPTKYQVEFVEYEVDTDLANPLIWKCSVTKLIELNTGEKRTEKHLEKVGVAEMFLTQLQALHDEQKKTKIHTSQVMFPLPVVDPWEEILDTCSVTDLEGSAGGYNESFSDFKGVIVYPDNPDPEHTQEEIIRAFLRAMDSMDTQEQEEKS